MMIIMHNCLFLFITTDGSESEHQVFGKFCSGCFLELLQWPVHMHAGVFGIGGWHLSQWVVGVQ